MPEPSAIAPVSRFALALLGRADESACKTIIRMCDRGELAHVRVGVRRDRMIPLSEVERLHREAEANRREAAAS